MNAQTFKNGDGGENVPDGQSVPANGKPSLSAQTKMIQELIRISREAGGLTYASEFSRRAGVSVTAATAFLNNALNNPPPGVFVRKRKKKFWITDTPFAAKTENSSDNPMAEFAEGFKLGFVSGSYTATHDSPFTFPEREVSENFLAAFKQGFPEGFKRVS